MNIAGYLIHGQSAGLGDAYTYTVAKDGVYLSAENEHFSATIQIAECDIRGLKPVEPGIILEHGKIPAVLFELALSIFLADITKEHYLAITWHDGEYHLITVDQEEKSSSVQYRHVEGAVLDLHSHCNMRAGFSGQDNSDEKGFRIYGVVGRLGKRPEVMLRLGVYGYYALLLWDDVFDGTLSGVVDVLAKNEELEYVES
jgi:PRTRC genetic system protein A